VELLEAKDANNHRQTELACRISWANAIVPKTHGDGSERSFTAYPCKVLAPATQRNKQGSRMVTVAAGSRRELDLLALQ
jgi:hypothetical protein